MVSETGLYCGIPRVAELEPSSPAGDERRESKLTLSITATFATSYSDIWLSVGVVGLLIGYYIMYRMVNFRV